MWPGRRSRRGPGAAAGASDWRRSDARACPRSISPASRTAARRGRPVRPRDKARREYRSRRRHALRTNAHWRDRDPACGRCCRDSSAGPWRRREARARRGRRRSTRSHRGFQAERRNGARSRDRVRPRHALGGRLLRHRRRTFPRSPARSSGRLRIPRARRWHRGSPAIPRRRWRRDRRHPPPHRVGANTAATGSPT